MVVIGIEWIFLPIIIVILAVTSIAVVIRGIAKRLPSRNERNVNFLKERLAKGEITQEEFDKLKKEVN